MTTKEAVADVPAPMVLSTLIVYLVVYAVLLGAYIGCIFYLARRASQGKNAPIAVPGSGAAVPKSIPAE